MSLRIITIGMISLAAMTGSAAASSFVTFGEPAPAATPSIVVMGAPDPIKVAATDSAKPETPADPSQQALSQMTPGSWQQLPATAAVEPEVISPSIVAYGTPWPPVTYEKVAAIPKKTSSKSHFAPMVIRGGLVGDVFAPATASVQPQQASADGGATAPTEAPATSAQPMAANRNPAPQAR